MKTFRAHLASESGISMLEVLVAMVLLLVGLLAVLDTVASSTDNIGAGARSAAMAETAQQTLQSTEALYYADIADSSAPIQTSTTNTNNPTYYLKSSGCSTTTCYQWDPTSSANIEPLDIDAVNGKVAPGPTNVVVPAPTGTCTVSAETDCQMTFSVYVFVTESTDSVCSGTGVTCVFPSYKRITVAVVNTGAGAPFKPLYLSAFVANKSGGTNNPLTLSTTTCLDGGTSVSCTH